MDRRNLAALFLLYCAVSAPGYSRSIAYDAWGGTGALTTGTSVTLPTSSGCGNNLVLDYGTQTFCPTGFTTALAFSPGFTGTANSYSTYQIYAPGPGGYQEGYATAYVWDSGANFKNNATGDPIALPTFTSFQFAPAPPVGPDPAPLSPASLAAVLVTPYSALGSTGFTITFDYLQTSMSSNGGLVVTELPTCAAAPASFTVNNATYSAKDPCKSGEVAFDFLNGAFHDSIAGGLLGTTGLGAGIAESVLPAGWSCRGSGCGAAAPEIDGASASSALTLLLGIIAVLRVRKPPESEALPNECR